MSKLSAVKAKHDELLSDLESYLSDPEADVAIATEKEATLEAVKAEMEAAIAVEGKLNAHRESAKALSNSRTPAPHNYPQTKPLSLGERLVQSDAFKSFRQTGARHAQVDFADIDYNTLKATLGSTGLTSLDILPGVTQLGTQRLTVADLLAQGTTTSAVVRAVVENSFTNYASPTSEGTAKPDATFDLTETDFPVRKIACIGRVSDELMNDHAQVASYVNARLVYSVGLVEEQQLLAGSGTSPELKGILNTAGIQTQAKSTDSAADAIYKGITLVRSVGFDEPSGMIIHPSTWASLRLTKDGASQYYGGGPFSTGAYGNGIQAVDQFWGLPVVITTAITAGVALVGAFRTQAQLFRRQGLTVDMSNQEGTSFQNNLIAIRAELRSALVVYRSKSFVKITGL